MASEKVEMANGATLHVSGQGSERWVCAAYDHGPFCRLCQPVDLVMAGLIENIREGLMVCRTRPDGEMEFQVTEAGKARAKALIAEAWAALGCEGEHPALAASKEEQDA